MNNIPYAIGLDIGISSVGSAIIALNEMEEPCGIVRMGVRTFDAAETPKTGASLAEPRRLARGMRRRLRRHSHRLERIRALIVSGGILTGKQLDALYTAKDLEDVYALRVQGLSMPLTPSQFARVLIHLAQRRGFKSNRKADKAGKDAKDENGKLLSAVEANRQRMQENGWRTAGEMFLRDPFYAQHKRNKGENYLSTISRDMVQDEARQLFSVQRGMGQPFASEEIEKKYLEILLSQRSFDEGPGGNSPYGGSQIQRMRGTCVFETGEKRAPKAAYSFELFRLLQKINHLRIYRMGESRALTEEERKKVLDKAHETADFTYKSVRSALKETLSAEDTFSGVLYRQDARKDPETLKFEPLTSYHILRKALDTIEKNYIGSISVEKLDAIAEVLTCYKQENTVRDMLLEVGCSVEETQALLQVTSFAKFGHLSLTAIRKLLPFLQQGDTYDVACANAGYDHRAHEKAPQMTLPAVAPEMQEITSPVVRRAVAQTIKVVNAIIRMMGTSPVYVNIELAREMAKDFNERKEMDKSMRENEARNEGIVKQLKEEFGVAQPTGLDIVKLKLYHQQQGLCAYSLRPLDIRRIFEKGYAEIDHIIPYSISFDDSYNNKALILSKENRDKRNRLPLQYLRGEQKEQFIVHTNNANYPYRKKLNLLKKAITKEDEARFKERNLQDTKHMSRFLYNYLNDHLLFAPSPRKKRVTAVSGSITSHLRKRWGLSKVREDGDTHHALDAVVIVCATDGMIQKISRFYDWKENHEYTQSEDGTYSTHRETGEIFPHPWPNFRNDVLFRMGPDPRERLTDLRKRGQLPSYDAYPQLIDMAQPLFVSRMPRRKVTGQAHMETIKGQQSPGETIRKVPLSDLKLVDGEIANYYRPQDDLLLYNHLKDLLMRHGGDAKKAFQQPVYKPAPKGGTPSLVKKVKLVEKSTLTVPVHGGKGAAANGSMVRVDLFHVPGDGYYLVPIYVSDTIKEQLPNKACVQAKDYNDWKEMKPEDFIFSLYPNDLIRIRSKRDIKMLIRQNDSTLPRNSIADQQQYYYYSSSNISVATIQCITHDSAYQLSVGIKTLQSIEKFQVDVLGNITPVHREERQTFRQ